MRNSLLPIGTALLLFLPLTGAQAQTAPELREDGVLYFEDNLPNKITATLKAPATVFLRRDFQMAAAYLRPAATRENRLSSTLSPCCLTPTAPQRSRIQTSGNVRQSQTVSSVNRPGVPTPIGELSY